MSSAAPQSDNPLSPTQPLPAAAVSLEVLRSVAHELRQPLSSIESIAYYLSLVLPRTDPKVQEHLTRIQELVEQANWIVSNGLRVADPALEEPACGQIDLEEIITEAVSSRSAGRPDLNMQLAGDLPPVRLDPNRARALVDGLLILFRQIATAVHPATLRTGVRSEGGVLLEIASAAPGFRSEAALGPGSALEIDSARRIAESHGGTLECLVDPAAGVCFRARLA
jgi:light-regulated signal transduction histidine kinase (bacteriophytochrome)